MERNKRTWDISRAASIKEPTPGSPKITHENETPTSRGTSSAVKSVRTSAKEKRGNAKIAEYTD